MYKKLKEVDIDVLVDEFNFLFKSILLDKDQVSLQKRAQTPTKLELTESCGSLTYDIIKDKKVRKNVELKDTDFNQVVKILKNTYIEELIEEFKLFRTRLMCLKSKTCLTWHDDYSQRVHIPLITNDKCFMVIENTKINLESGYAYQVDTTKMHTAVNASLENRYHIVGCVN